MNIYLTRLQGQFTSRGNVAVTVAQGRQTGTVSLTEVPVRPLPQIAAGLTGLPALRPGVRISGRVVSSDPSVVRVDTPEVTFADTAFSGSFNYTPLTAGTAILSLELPAGVAVEPVRGRIAVTVQ